MPLSTSAMPGQFPDQMIGQQGLQTDVLIDEILWEITRFWPPVDLHIPAFSTEPHIVKVTGTLPDAATLGLDELTTIGFEIAFHKGVGPLLWVPMEPDEARNAALSSSATGFYFRLLIGPDADFSLAPGPYFVSVRTATIPHAARYLPQLIVEPPLL